MHTRLRAKIKRSFYPQYIHFLHLSFIIFSLVSFTSVSSQRELDLSLVQVLYKHSGTKMSTISFFNHAYTSMHLLIPKKELLMTIQARS